MFHIFDGELDISNNLLIFMYYIHRTVHYGRCVWDQITEDFKAGKFLYVP